MHGRAVAAPAAPTDAAAATADAGGDASRDRQRAHARVFFGSWQRSFDGARDAGDVARAQALCDDLHRIASGLGERTLGEAAATLGELLATDDAPTTREASVIVERELRRLIAEMASGG
jgi:hypothetical protein